MPEPTHPRCSSNQCAACRKEFKPGDRITTAHIVVKTGFSEQTREWGAYLADGFEMVHINCVDPQLSGKVITL